MRDDNTSINRDRITGSILALALGDAFGAPHEGGILERLLWSLLGRRSGKRCWTDDTRMSLDIMESLISCNGIDQDDLARRFAQSYRWSRGYGPGAARLLKRIRRGEPWQEVVYSVYPDGSFGNGAAMRTPVVGLFFSAQGEEAVVRAALATAAVTHGHPLASDGAVLISLATARMYQDMKSAEIIARSKRHLASDRFMDKLTLAAGWLTAGEHVATKTVAAKLGNGICAVDSCVTALYAALAFREESFEKLLQFVKEIGGDVDTIGAMAGGIWGAGRGVEALPETFLCQLEQRKYLEEIACAFAKKIGAHSAPYA